MLNTFSIFLIFFFLLTKYFFYLLKKKILKKKIAINKNPKKIKGPGQFKFHYSPGIPVIMNRKYREENQAFVGFGKKFKEGREWFIKKKSHFK